MKTLTVKSNAGSVKISLEDALLFFGEDAIHKGEKRGEIKTYGPWTIITSYKALAVTATWTPVTFGNSHVDEYTLYGDRTISNPRQSGYELEGWVSIRGEKRSCFTSSVLFELPGGKLINIAVIFVRSNKV